MLVKFERQNALRENRMPARFVGRQPNLIDNSILRVNSLTNNSVSVSPLRYLSQDNVQERRHQNRRDKEVRKISKKLKDQNVRSIAVSSNNKRVEYFPDENIIIKGSGSASDPVDITEDDTDIYSDEENPREKKIANKVVDYSLGKKKLIGDKLRMKRSKIKYKVLIPEDRNMNREIRIGIF
jgi:hypothetical protein